MAVVTLDFDARRRNKREHEALKEKETYAKLTVERALTQNRIKKDDDVTELYLANSNLERVCSYSRFKNLQRLWLNNNKLRSIRHGLSHNYCLAELYLHNNQLTSVHGALRRLRNLRVLMLHNNQISNVEKVVSELDKMQDLRILSLFNNPVSQEPDYRSYVIHHLPSVEILDRREVLRLEREVARRQYNQDEEAVKERIAFGRRSEGPPVLYHRREINRPLTVPRDFEFGNSFYRSHPQFGSMEEAFNERLAKKSAMQFSHFDWASMPGSAVRRTSNKPVIDPHIVTVKFR